MFLTKGNNFLLKIFFVLFLIGLLFYLDVYNYEVLDSKYLISVIIVSIINLIILLGLFKNNNHLKVNKVTVLYFIFLFYQIIVTITSIYSLNLYSKLFRYIFFNLSFLFIFCSLSNKNKESIFYIFANIIILSAFVFSVLYLMPKNNNKILLYLNNCFGNKNFFSAFLVFSIPLVYQKIIESNRKVSKILFIFMILTVIYVVILTLTRASYIALGFMMVLLFINVYRHINSKFRMQNTEFINNNIEYSNGLIPNGVNRVQNTEWNKKDEVWRMTIGKGFIKDFKKYLLVFGSIVFLLILIVSFNSSVKNTFKSIFNVTHSTNRFRILTYHSATKMIRENFLFGTGRGSFRVGYPKYRNKWIIKFEKHHHTETAHVHNELLEIAVESGIIGIGLFLLLIYLVIEYCPKKYVFLLIALLSLFFNNVFGVNIRYSTNFMIFIIALTFLLSVLDVSVKRIKPKKYLLILGILIIVFAVIYEYRLSRTNKYLFYAVSNSKQKQYVSAETKYKKCIEYDKNMVTAYYFLGTNYSDMTRYRYAYKMYKKTIKLAPYYVMVYYRLGMVCMKLNLLNESINNYIKQITLDPLFTTAYNKLAWSYIKQKDYYNSAVNFEKSLKINSKQSGVYTNLGNCYYYQNRPDIAVKTFQKGLTLFPDNIEIKNNLVSIYILLKKYKEAVIMNNSILAEEPNNKDALRNRDILLLRLGE